MNKTKTIATIGPTTQKKEILRDLIINGVDLIRFNMNYASQDFCLDILDKIKKIDKELNTNTGIIVDLSGPSIRVNNLIGGQAELEVGTKIRIYMEKLLGDGTKFSVSYSNLVDEVKYNSKIKMSDGTVELRVIDKQYNYLLCEVEKGGMIFDNQKIVVPDHHINLEFLSKKDRDNIIFANEINADFLSLSFVSNAEDVLQVNDFLIELGNDHLQILAKIENEEAYLAIDEIIKVSDGIIIARGDLGIALPVERIPGIQKAIISKCHKYGKLSIVATELLSSMENANRPTRAEVSDVANAVLDGADAVVLCGETTVGKHPVETLIMMEKIMRSAEMDINHLEFLDRAARSEKQDITGVLAHSIVECANRLKCRAIVVPTISGLTAKKISRFRPSCPIIAITPNIEIVRGLNPYFGIKAILIDDFKTFDEITNKAKEIACSELDLQPNDRIIITGGYPFKKIKHTNFIKIEEI